MSTPTHSPEPHSSASGQTSSSSSDLPSSTSLPAGWVAKAFVLNEVDIDGTTYLLPSCSDDDGQTIEGLDDGSDSVQLFCDRIVIGSLTFNVPKDLSQPTTLTAGGKTVKVNLSPSSSESHTAGISGLFDLLGGVKDAAGSAMGAMNDVLTTAGSWIDNGMDPAKIPSILGKVSKARTELGNCMSRSRQLPTAYPGLETELENFKPSPGRAIFDSLIQGPKQCNSIDLLGKALKSLPKASRESAAKINALIKSLVARGPAIPKLTQISLDALWGVALMGLSTTAVINSANKPQRDSYYFVTKNPTALKTFLDFISKLPDSGTGYKEDQTTQSTLEWQLYITKLSKKEAAVVAMHPMVSYSGLHRNPTGEEAGYTRAVKPINRASHIQSRDDIPSNSNSNRYERTEKFPHCQLLSQKTRPPNLAAPYLFRPELGKGSTIFVIDTGYNMNHEEFNQPFRPAGDSHQRKITTHVIPNSLTLSNYPQGGAPEDTTDYAFWNKDLGLYEGHGTGVAVTAAGVSLGVASRADLFLIKAANGVNTGTRYEAALGPQAADESAFRKIFETIDNNADLKGRSVIVYAKAWRTGTDQSAGAESLFTNVLKECKTRQIPLVVGAGNFGNPAAEKDKQTLDSVIPQRLGTDDNNNPLITVGGVKEDGTLWLSTNPKKPGGGGWMNTYALGADVPTALSGTQDDQRKNGPTSQGYGLRDGTSFAAPAVAGFIAYIMSLDDLRPAGPDGWTIAKVKEFIADNSYERYEEGHPIQGQDKVPSWYPPLPDAVKVPYNLAQEELCDIAFFPGHKQRSLEKPKRVTRSLSSGLYILPAATDLAVISNGKLVMSDFDFGALSCSPTRSSSSKASPVASQTKELVTSRAPASSSRAISTPASPSRAILTPVSSPRTAPTVRSSSSVLPSLKTSVLSHIRLAATSNGRSTFSSTSKRSSTHISQSTTHTASSKASLSSLHQSSARLLQSTTSTGLEVFHPTDLPVLTKTQQYCLEVLSNGQPVYHEKIGACTYATATPARTLETTSTLAQVSSQAPASSSASSSLPYTAGLCQISIDEIVDSTKADAVQYADIALSDGGGKLLCNQTFDSFLWDVPQQVGIDKLPWNVSVIFTSRTPLKKGGSTTARREQHQKRTSTGIPDVPAVAPTWEEYTVQVLVGPNLFASTDTDPLENPHCDVGYWSKVSWKQSDYADWKRTLTCKFNC